MGIFQWLSKSRWPTCQQLRTCITKERPMNRLYSGARRGAFATLLIPPLLMILVLLPISGRAAVNIADHDITHQINSEFIYDPAVPLHTIKVSTDHGIVTLTGRVSNLLARERATHIAETVRGVRSVINRIEVKPRVQRSAKWLRQAVKNALSYDAATNAYEITVNADDQGQVSLNGSVDSMAERQLAETVAKGVTGVTSVSDSIVIRPGTQRLDRELRKEIQQRLHWDRLVDDGLIITEVKDGKATLSGAVGSAAEKRRAAADAWVAGIKEVDNASLEVEKWARDDELRKNKYAARSDLEIINAVRDALVYDPRVNATELQVRVDNGVVTLRGVVDNIKAMMAAQRDAHNTVGVVQVNSLIKVRPISKLDDDKIAQNVQRALQRNPFTENDDIQVTVKNQVVRLDGSVDSYFEKAEAENDAFLARGVRDVHNELKVQQPKAMNFDPYVYSWSIYTYPWYKNLTVVPNASDREIRNRIENELWWSPFVNAEDVNVSVDAGVATLSGNVDSWTEYNAARENAFEGGAIAVIDKLHVNEAN